MEVNISTHEGFEGEKGWPRTCPDILAVSILEDVSPGGRTVTVWMSTRVTRWGARWRHLANNTIVVCCIDRFIDTFTFNSGMPVPMRGQDLNEMTTIDVHFYMTHVNGYTFRLQPNQKFAGLPATVSETLRITGGGWSVSRSEVCCTLSTMLSTGCRGTNCH